MKDFDYRKYLAEGKLLNEAELTDDLVQRVAQAVADEFTAEDRELDLKYVITPNSIEADPRGGGFDLDVEAGPNTPGAEWKDERGFGIANYLGDYAGGSFYIKDGKVFNAAMRNAEIANVSDLLGIEQPGEETDYMQRRKEMDDYAIDENKETKKTKMKKSELKEMIKMALSEGDNYYEDSMDEAEEVDVEDNEKVDVDIEKDVEIDDESVETDIDVKGSMPGEDEDEIAVQSLLMKAQEEAEKLGDEKLTDQIGNTITYFTRAHVATVDEAKNDIKETLVDADQDMAEAILNALGGEAAFEAVVRAMSTDDAQIYLGGIIRDYSIGMEDEAEEIDEIAAMPGEEGVEDVNIDNPAEDAMVGLTESLRWQRIAGIAKDNGLYSK